MKLTKEQQKICDKYRARDEEGFVHCHECPLAIDHTYHLCLKGATRHDLKEYGMGVWMSKEEIALEEAEKMLKYGATDKEKVVAKVAIAAINKQIPKRPILTDHDHEDYFEKRVKCGACKCTIGSWNYGREWYDGSKKNFIERHKYCPCCSQAIDWSDEDDI